MISKAPSRSQRLPGIIQMEVHHLNKEGEMGTCHSSTLFMNHDELTLWKEAVMGGQFLIGVGTLRRIDHSADCRDLGVILIRHEPDGITLRKVETRFVHEDGFTFQCHAPEVRQNQNMSMKKTFRSSPPLYP